MSSPTTSVQWLDCDCSFITSVNMVNFLLKLFYSSLIFNHDIKGISPLFKRYVSVQGINGKFAMNRI